MAGYDKEKDKLIAEEIIHNGMYKVGLYQYNGGEPKIGVLEETSYKDRKTGQDVISYKKVGRVDVETAQLIAQAIINLKDKVNV
jgi:hypothetical protein